MKRKYGDSIEAILEYCAKIDDEIEMITNRESHIETLNKKLVSIEKDLLVEANHLTSLRKNAAEKLTEAIHKQLKDLYMDKTVFEVKFFEQDNIEFQPRWH